MTDLTRQQIALVLGAVLTVLALLAGVYGIVTGPPATDGRDARTGQGSGQGASDNDPGSTSLTIVGTDPTTDSLPHTTSEVRYARAAASALFTWDSNSGYLPADYQAPLLADADPTGDETPGLITDVTTYFPNLEQWFDLANLEVSQSLTITTAAVPTTWPSIVEQAHGELRAGTTAVTITGTRERAGVWHGEHRTATSPVAFTVFVACRPTFDRCHLLRLSELDNPLR